MSRTPFTVEALESRTLMSASGTAAVFNAAVAQDRLQIRVDLLKFKSDALSCQATLLGDIGAIKADDVKQATTVVPLLKTMHMDIRHMNLTLKLDRLTEAQNVVTDELAILKVRRQLLADNSNGNTSAVAADKAQILADRVQLQNDLIAGLNTRLATRQSAYQQIINDGQAVVNAVNADPNATAKLQADVQKWVADKTTCMNTMETDIQKLIADRTQLVSDLTASQSQV